MAVEWHVVSWLVGFTLFSLVSVFFIIAIFFKLFDVVVQFGMLPAVLVCAANAGAIALAAWCYYLEEFTAVLGWSFIAAVITWFIQRTCDPSGKIANAMDLTGANAIVTGGTGGMGTHIAAGLAERGAAVTVISVDSPAVVTAALATIEAAAQRGGKGGRVAFERVDLTSMAAVVEFAEKYTREHLYLNLLVCNAGVLTLRMVTTVDLFNPVIAVNYLSHFLLTERLLPLLRKGSKMTSARIVNVASESYKLSDAIVPDFNKIAHSVDAQGRSYLRSKLAVLLHTNKRQRLLDAEAPHGGGITVYAVHPGSMGTGLYADALPRLLWPLFQAVLNIVLRDFESGALVALHAALSPAAVQNRGCYFANLGPTEPMAKATDVGAADALYDETRALLAPFVR